MKKEEQERLATVYIPISLYQEIDERLAENRFTSVSSYVISVLREAVSEAREGEEPFTEEDEKRLQDRLRALGYF